MIDVQRTLLLFDDVDVTTDHESDDFEADEEDNTFLLGMVLIQQSIFSVYLTWMCIKPMKIS